MRHDSRSPRVRHTTFTLIPAAFTGLPSVQGLDFVVTCQLIRLPCLVCSFYSSGQRFATDFLQTPPHGDALVFRYNLPPDRWFRGLSPHKSCAMPGAHDKALGRESSSVPRSHMLANLLALILSRRF